VARHPSTRHLKPMEKQPSKRERTLIESEHQQGGFTNHEESAPSKRSTHFARRVHFPRGYRTSNIGRVRFPRGKCTNQLEGALTKGRENFPNKGTLLKGRVH